MALSMLQSASDHESDLYKQRYSEYMTFTLMVISKPGLVLCCNSRAKTCMQFFCSACVLHIVIINVIVFNLYCSEADRA